MTNGTRGIISEELPTVWKCRCNKPWRLGWLCRIQLNPRNCHTQTQTRSHGYVHTDKARCSYHKKSSSSGLGTELVLKSELRLRLDIIKVTIRVKASLKFPVGKFCDSGAWYATSTELCMVNHAHAVYNSLVFITTSDVKVPIALNFLQQWQAISSANQWKLPCKPESLLFLYWMFTNNVYNFIT